MNFSDPNLAALYAQYLAGGVPRQWEPVPPQGPAISPPSLPVGSGGMEALQDAMPGSMGYGNAGAAAGGAGAPGYAPAPYTPGMPAMPPLTGPAGGPPPSAPPLSTPPLAGPAGGPPPPLTPPPLQGAAGGPPPMPPGAAGPQVMPMSEAPMVPPSRPPGLGMTNPIGGSGKGGKGGQSGTGNFEEMLRTNPDRLSQLDMSDPRVRAFVTMFG